MNDGADVTEVLATASDQETEVYHGITFPGLYAMIARAHMAAGPEVILQPPDELAHEQLVRRIRRRQHHEIDELGAPLLGQLLEVLAREPDARHRVQSITSCR